MSVSETRPSLQTDRLILRPFSLSDAKDVQRLAGDYEVARTRLMSGVVESDQRRMLLFLIALLVANDSYAGERYLLLMGGGGEPAEKASTIFDPGLQGIGGFLSSSSWHSDVRFNGGHSETEGILKNDFKNSSSVGAFTVDSYNAMINKYKQQLQSGAIHSGDELMVMIDTHGGANEGEKTHSVCVGQAPSAMNLTTLKGASTVNLDSLQDLKALAEAKGVKLAIVDLSCHSGNTLALADDKTCVVSATGPKHFGYSGFADIFSGQMKPGRSLEDVFLATRGSESGTEDFPMISTPAGKELNDRLYAAATPYLYSSDADANLNKLSPYLEDAAEKNCSPDQDPTAIAAQIQQLKSVLNDRSVDTRDLTKLLDAYKKKQDGIVNTLRAWGAPKLNTKESCTVAQKDNGHRTTEYTLDFTWGELIRTDFQKNIDYLSSQVPMEHFSADRATLQASISCMKKFVAKTQEIESRFPELAGYGDKFKNLVAQMGDTHNLAGQIGDEYRKIYDSLYKDISKSDKGPNACKDFTF
jgi:hypothetical protein